MYSRKDEESFERNSRHRQAFNAKQSRFSEIVVDQKLNQKDYSDNPVPVLGKTVFSTAPDGDRTAHFLARSGMHLDTQLVRCTPRKFVNIQTMTIRGHSDAVASIMNSYLLEEHPCLPGIHVPSCGRAKDLGLECLNVVHTGMGVSVSTAQEMVSSYSRLPDDVVITFSVRKALALQAKFYRDITSHLHNVLIVGFPKGTMIPIRILPLAKTSHLSIMHNFWQQNRTMNEAQFLAAKSHNE